MPEIIRSGTEIGLSLNVSKCKLITHKDFHVDNVLLQLFDQVESALGAPLFHGDMFDAAWEDQYDDLIRAVDRLRITGSQEALILLRSSFSASRVLCFLRCSPSASTLLSVSLILPHETFRPGNHQL